MRKFILIVAALDLGGCAFYEKQYVSAVALEGTNYRAAIYDEGQFYINDEPSITIRMGCYQRTLLGSTMFPLIPLPVFNEEPRHDSIASQQFSLTISHRQQDAIDLSALRIDIELSEAVHVMRFARKEEPPFSRSLAYQYMADLRCRDIEDGVLRIYLEADKVREYGVQFEEGVKREIAYHTSFVT